MIRCELLVINKLVVKEIDLNKMNIKGVFFIFFINIMYGILINFLER